MPSSLHWRSYSKGRPLRLTVPCSATAARTTRSLTSARRLYCIYSSRSSYSSQSSHNNAPNHVNCRWDYHIHHLGPKQSLQIHHSHTSQVPRPIQPQPLLSQSRVYQTSSSTSIPVIQFPASSFQPKAAHDYSPRTSTDLPGARRENDYATPFPPTNTSSSLPSSLLSPLTLLSSSSLIAPFTPPFSQRKRRNFARWLPALMATQVRSHSDDTGTKNNNTKSSHGNGQHEGHSHSHGLFSHHHHSHDNAYLTSQNKKDSGVRITRIGLYSNLGMALAKGAGGYFFNSQSMVADAWHSLTDLASDFLTLATVSWSLRPPTDKFPTGFGKVESLGSLGVSGMLLGGGIFMCMSSLQILHAHFFLDAAAAAEVMAHAHGHSHSHAHDHSGPSLHAAWLALGTVLVKEWLYRTSKLFQSPC